MFKIFKRLFSRLRPRTMWTWPTGLVHAPGPVPMKRFVSSGSPPPMQWKACHPRTEGRYKAQLTCSRGHGITLSRHSIEPDGRVHPSVVCRSPGCGFHEVVRLEGWTGGYLA